MINSLVRDKDLAKQLAVNRQEICTFWRNLERVFDFNYDNTLTIVTESHLGAYAVANLIKAKSVYSFDEYSDLGFSKDKEKRVDCGNWLGKYLHSKDTKATVVYSDCNNEDIKMFGHLAHKVCFTTLAGLQAASVTYICRSSAWTPPWLDKYFFEFVKPFNNVLCDICQREWDYNEVANQAVALRSEIESM